MKNTMNRGKGGKMAEKNRYARSECSKNDVWLDIEFEKTLKNLHVQCRTTTITKTMFARCERPQDDL